MREGDLDALIVEGALQAAQVLAPHRPLLQRCALETASDDDRRVVPALHPSDLQRLEDERLEGRIGTHPGAGPAHDIHDRVDVLAIGHADVHDREGVPAAVVDHRADLAAGHEVHLAVVVAQLPVAQ